MWQTPVSSISPANVDALGLELGARRGDVVDVQREVGVLLRRELHPNCAGSQIPRQVSPDPEVVLRLAVGAQPERLAVERRARSESCEGTATKSSLVIIGR